MSEDKSALPGVQAAHLKSIDPKSDGVDVISWMALIKQPTNEVFRCSFFNLQDKLREHEIEVKYCPTESMVAGFFTKPLQGKQFNKLKRIIMGVEVISALGLNSNPVNGSKERVAKIAKPASADFVVDPCPGARHASYAECCVKVKHMKACESHILENMKSSAVFDFGT